MIRARPWRDGPGEPEQFEVVYGDKFRTVREYWHAIKHVVEVIDLEAIVPTFQKP